MTDVIMKIEGVMKRLPQRYPFLMVDRVVECDPGKSLVAIKNLTINEPFFQGHFPAKPVLPGVLILEAMAQATGLLAYCSEDKVPDNTIFLFVGINKARFKRQVEPGDQLRLEVRFLRRKRHIWVFGGEARVDGVLAASAELMCAQQRLDD
jgi:3-hydroxyacyl-[acyl-carrier-protein] dehydratase